MMEGVGLYLLLVLCVTATTSWGQQETPCDDLTPPDNGRISYTDGSTNSRPVGTVASCICSTGFVIQGDVTTTCELGGEWSVAGSAPGPTCDISFCGFPPSISNGSPGTPTSIMVGGTVTYSCDPGYIMSDSSNSLVTCLSTGNWSAPPSCQIIPPVYLSLSSTNYLSGLPQINLSSVGEGFGNSLVCHLYLNTSGGGQGNWYYPNGSLVTSEGEWYVTRGDEVVSLNRRTSAQTPGGLYCCVVPTDDGTHTACIVVTTGQSESSSQSVSDHVGVLVGSVVAVVAVIVVIVDVVLTTLYMRSRRHKLPRREDIRNGSGRKGLEFNDRPTASPLSPTPQTSANRSGRKGLELKDRPTASPLSPTPQTSANRSGRKGLELKDRPTASPLSPTPQTSANRSGRKGLELKDRPTASPLSPTPQTSANRSGRKGLELKDRPTASPLSPTPQTSANRSGRKGLELKDRPTASPLSPTPQTSANRSGRKGLELKDRPTASPLSPTPQTSANRSGRKGLELKDQPTTSPLPQTPQTSANSGLYYKFPSVAQPPQRTSTNRSGHKRLERSTTSPPPQINADSDSDHDYEIPFVAQSPQGTRALPSVTQPPQKTRAFSYTSSRSHKVPLSVPVRGASAHSNPSQDPENHYYATFR